MRALVIGVLVFGFVAACERGREEAAPADEADEPAEDDDDDLCARAVDHVIFNHVPDGAPGQPSEGERRIMEQVAAQSERTCRREGLSEEQAACIFAVNTPDDMLCELPNCPAIAEERPSWLTIPSPEEMAELGICDDSESSLR